MSTLLVFFLAVVIDSLNQSCVEIQIRKFTENVIVQLLFNEPLLVTVSLATLDNQLTSVLVFK